MCLSKARSPWPLKPVHLLRVLCIANFRLFIRLCTSVKNCNHSNVPWWWPRITTSHLDYIFIEIDKWCRDFEKKNNNNYHQNLLHSIQSRHFSRFEVHNLWYDNKRLRAITYNFLIKHTDYMIANNDKFI